MQFREKIIELFADAKDSISVLKDGIPGPPEESDLGERMIGDIDFLVKEEKLKFQTPSEIFFAALN